MKRPISLGSAHNPILSGSAHREGNIRGKYTQFGLRIQNYRGRRHWKIVGATTTIKSMA